MFREITKVHEPVWLETQYRIVAQVSKRLMENMPYAASARPHGTKSLMPSAWEWILGLAEDFRVLSGDEIGRRVYE